MYIPDYIGSASDREEEEDLANVITDEVEESLSLFHSSGKNGGLQEYLTSIDNLIGWFGPQQYAQDIDQDHGIWQALLVVGDYSQGFPLLFYLFNWTQGNYFN